MFWNKKQPNKKRIYLDYASATPIRKEVAEKMQPYFGDTYGNAGAIHREGVQARKAIENARAELAKTLRVRPSGIVFTGSGTESNNLAIIGVIETCRKRGVVYEDMEVVSTRLEHASVLQVLEHLQSLGVVVRYAHTDEYGLIETTSFTECLTPKTVLVVLGYVNSEIGVVQHVSKLTRIVRAYEKKHGTSVLVHADAAQAALWLSCALDALAVDTLALDAGKCYGPKGVGVLVLKQGVTLVPYFFGGSQEHGLRPGTENTASIVGAVDALVRAQKNYVVRAKKVSILRDVFISQLLTVPGVVLNGSHEDRVANNVNISIAGIDSEFAVIVLDEQGIACATKSACGGAKGDGSAVVEAITGDKTRAMSTLRFTLGEETTLAELTHTTVILRVHIEKTRNALQKLTKQ